MPDDRLRAYALPPRSYLFRAARNRAQAQANYPLAANLKGKLLLIHGDMDDNVPPANTLRLAQALTAANKPFDMMIYPDGDHGILRTPHAIGLTIDYFVKHLLGVEPPPNYVFKRAQ